MKKRIFVGSSTESLEIANNIEDLLRQFRAEPITWEDKSVFKLTGNTWEDLNTIAHNVDGAIFVFSDDDTTWYRDKFTGAVRDNVILEFGLFSGVLSKNNVCFVRKEEAKLPTDVLGITYASFELKDIDKEKIKDWVKGLSPVSPEREMKDNILKSVVMKKNTQEDIVESMLSQFCKLISVKANLKKPIEAVVVLFCKKNQKRMTFYSCNKGNGQNKHNYRDLHSGVVGLLIKNYEENHDGDLIVYYDKKMENSFQIRKINRSHLEITEKWEVSQGEKQSWSKGDTTSMFAIPFFVTEKGKSYMIGALTFDLCDSLYKGNESNKKKIDDLCKGLIATRDAVEKLLIGNIESDFTEYGIALDKLKKDNCKRR